MKQSPLFIFYKASSFMACLLYFNYSHGQQLTMSSMGMLNNTTNLSAAMNFKSNANCIDVQSGIANYTTKLTYGDFSIDCKIDQKINTLGLKLYPNPVKATAKLKFSNTVPLNEIFNVSICNAEGTVMRILNTNGYALFQGYHLNLNDLTAGTYILKIESPQFIEALKFIKIN
jgi:hypothetical protein